MGRARQKGLAADYGGASPEDVARALHGHRPDEIVSVEIKADRAGVPMAQLAALQASESDPSQAT